MAMLGVYFAIVSFISGWSFAVDQFAQFRYFIVALALGFGIQIGLYAYLRSAIYHNASKGAVAVSGITSTVAMVSCCAHYLANILPIIGIAGVVSIIGQYQVELFWVGLAANAAGIVYITRQIKKLSQKITCLTK